MEAFLLVSAVKEMYAFTVPFFFYSQNQCGLLNSVSIIGVGEVLGKSAWNVAMCCPHTPILET